jgi:cytochrome b6-f complex iron-sulfur subunit
MKNERKEKEADGAKELSRRSFLKALAVSGGAIAVGSWLAACGVGAQAPASTGGSGASGGLIVDLTKPENQSLSTVGGTLALDSNSVDTVGLFLYRASDTSVLAFSRKCTHLGCQVNAYQQGVAQCPCHGSEYDLSGKPIKGPARQPLKQYTATLSGTQVTVSA